MSILGNIFRKIFPGRDHDKPATTSTAQAPATAGAPSPAQPAPVQQAPAQPPVDIEAVLTALAKDNPQKLNWRTSIVDLMKLVGMESSLAERKELAKELGYTGDTGDTATMNVWLHKQVMQQLAKNGGKVPADLLD